MLLVDAIYIHESGGKELLLYLIEELEKTKSKCFFLLDKRLPKEVLEHLPSASYLCLSGSEKTRASFYKKKGNEFGNIFCFANVPPPVPLTNSRVVIFMQNVLLLSSFPEFPNYSLKQRISYLIKGLYIKYQNRPNYHWLVQSRVMQTKLEKRIGVDKSCVHILPFFRETGISLTKPQSPISFLYVADGVAQKNHLTLLSAWEYIFDSYKLRPVLHLTIPAEFVALVERIDYLNKKGLTIINHGRMAKPVLQSLYTSCHYLVFPSLAESFGLPLVEAASFGCGILAADRPYVYELIEPSFIFDPLDKESIASSVLEVLNKPIKAAGLIVQNHIKEVLNMVVS